MGTLIGVRVPDDLLRRAKRVIAETPKLTQQQVVSEGLDIRVRQLERKLAKKQKAEESARG